MSCPECGCTQLLIRLLPDATTGECLGCGTGVVRDEGGKLITAPAQDEGSGTEPGHVAA
jgi:ribosomal protein S27E